MAPVYVDEEIEATVEVVKIREDKPIATLKTHCVKSDGTIALEGEAVVKVNWNTINYDNYISQTNYTCGIVEK